MSIVAIDAMTPPASGNDKALKLAYDLANRLERDGYQVVLVRPGRDAICEAARNTRRKIADVIIEITT